jgi:RNA polymerase sigma-70 factor (ECF subfamily)
MPLPLNQKILDITVPVMSSSAEDRHWIQRTLAGDPDAYAHLINKYKSQLFDLTCRILKDRCQGEDILQDAFLQAYRHLSSFRYESKFSTWIYTIVLNRVRNHLRRNKIVRWSSLDSPRQGEDNDYASEIEHKEPSIELTLERKMDLEAIQRAAASIPVLHQTIFIMHYFQNLTLQEIADRLGRPAGTVKVYLHRSRQMLYKKMKRGALRPVLAASSIACFAV